MFEEDSSLIRDLFVPMVPTGVSLQQGDQEPLRYVPTAAAALLNGSMFSARPSVAPAASGMACCWKELHPSPPPALEQL